MGHPKLQNRSKRRPSALPNLAPVVPLLFFALFLENGTIICLALKTTEFAKELA